MVLMQHQLWKGEERTREEGCIVGTRSPRLNQGNDTEGHCFQASAAASKVGQRLSSVAVGLNDF